MELKFVNDYGTLIGFELRGKTIFHQEYGLTEIWGIPIKFKGSRYVEKEQAIFACYEADFASMREGKVLEGTTLELKQCQSCNSLSDATIYHLAFHREYGLISQMRTSYWVSDAGDEQDWHHSLRQQKEFLSGPVLESV